jgi:hypothetical protein
MANLLVYKVDNVFFDFVDLLIIADKMNRMDGKNINGTGQAWTDGNPIRSIGDSAKGRGASGIPAYKIVCFYEMSLIHAITDFIMRILRLSSQAKNKYF